MPIPDCVVVARSHYRADLLPCFPEVIQWLPNRKYMSVSRMGGVGLGSWSFKVSTWEGGSRAWSWVWCAGVGDGPGGPLPLPEL